MVSIHSSNWLFPHNLFSGENSQWQLEVVNNSNSAWENAVLEIAVFSAGGKTIPTDSLTIGAIAANSRMKQAYTLKMPNLSQGNYQLRLTVKVDNKDISRNYYDLFIAKREFPQITPARPVYVYDTGSDKNVDDCIKLLTCYGITPGTIKDLSTLTGTATLIIPAENIEKQELRLDNSNALTDFIRNRGGILLVLEQRNPQSRLPGNLVVSAESRPFVDLVSPAHPIFSGLDYTEFDTWNNPDHGYIVKNTFMPYITNALAVKGPTIGNSNIGNAVIEGTDGKGRIICSQLETSACREHDSAAMTYMNNLIAYATGAAFWQDTLPLADSDAHEYTVANVRITPIDLTPYVNTNFTDEVAEDRKGGWTDQGTNDFRFMPLGRQVAGGVPFVIINPAENQGKSCIVLRGSKRPDFVSAVKDIKIDKRLSRLFFLHTAAWAYNGGSPGSYRINYADNTSAIYRLECGKNIGDWWNVTQISDAKIGIVRNNTANHKVGTYVSCWENPYPGKMICSIDFLSATEARGNVVDWLPSDAPVPLLIAITGETRSDTAVNLLGKNYHHTMGRATPATCDGGRCVNIAFGTRAAGAAPSNGVICFKKENLGNDYTTLSCWIKSDRAAILRFQLPEEKMEGTLSWRDRSQRRWTVSPVSVIFRPRFYRGASGIIQNASWRIVYFQ